MSTTNNSSGEGRGLPPELEERDGLLVYRGSVPFDELPIPEPVHGLEDYEWADNDPEVNRLYNGLVVAVAGRRVWGAGKTDKAAWEEAQRHPDCPPAGDLVFVWVLARPRNLKPEEGDRGV